MHGYARQEGPQGEEGRRDDTIREFRDHAVTFATINGGLIALNLATGPHYLWALWPLFGWGIGFAAHAAGTYQALRAERDRGATLVAPPLMPTSESERERPWPDLEER